MKWFVFSIVLACTTSATAQFIPQPMGYNPDENGDDLIGVNDLQGLLSLYGQPFDNGDSVVVTSWHFPEDYPEEYQYNIENVVHIDIEESTDFLYVHQDDPQEVFFWLPQGDGFKVLQVFLSTSSPNWFARIHLSNLESSNAYGGSFVVHEDQPLHITFIRGHNGMWYQQGRP